MNRMMTMSLWAVAAFVVTMVFNLNPAFAQTRGSAPQMLCPNPMLVETARAACSDPNVAAQCPSQCAQVACINNCLQPPAPGPVATTPPPAPKKLTQLPTQVICEGGTLTTNSENKPDCGCPPEKVTDEKGATREVPRVPVLKTPLQYKATETTSQTVKTLVCVSTGDATAILNKRLNDHEKRIKTLEDFATQQGYVNEAVRQQLIMLWAEVNRIKGWLRNIQLDIQNINASLAQIDAAYGKLRREIEGLAEGSTSFSIAVEGSAFNMGDAGTALAPGLRIGFRSFFPGSKFGYYAMGNVGLIYRDGIEPGSGGQGSAYHAGAGTGLVFMLTDNRALTGYAGFRFEQIFRTKDPNFLGAMFGGVLGLDYQIPDSHVFVGGEGFLAGTYRVAYFSNDGQVHMNGKPALFGGSLYVGLRTNLF